MRSLAAAIARTEFYLRLLPSPLARRAAILARLNKETDADESIVHLHDDIGRFAGGMFWPFKPMRLLQMPALGPAFHLLTPLSDLHREIWAARPGMAAAFPDGLFLGSLSYRHVYGALDERYVAYFPYPCRAGGEQVVVFLVRNRSRTMPFGERELRAMTQICRHFASELSSVGAGDHLPQQGRAQEHTLELDAALCARPRHLTPYLRAAFDLFYGVNGHGAGAVTLPVELVAELQHYHRAALALASPTAAGCRFVFTRRRHGRALCLHALVRSDGSVQLTIQEDFAQFDRLRKIVGACRELPRDRVTVLNACLVLADGVLDNAQVARRAGFGALHPTAAAKIVARARSIVAAAS